MPGPACVFRADLTPFLAQATPAWKAGEEVEVTVVRLPVAAHVADMVDCTGAGDTLVAGTVRALASLIPHHETFSTTIQPSIQFY